LLMTPTPTHDNAVALVLTGMRLLFTNPREYWRRRAEVPGDWRSLLMPEVLVMAGLPALGLFWGTLIGGLLPSLNGGRLMHLLAGALLSLGADYLLNLALWAAMALVISFFSDTFGATRDPDASRKLATGLMVPTWLGGVLSVTSFRAVGMGYGGHLLLLGMDTLLPVPRANRVVFTVLVLGLLIIGTLLTMVISGVPASQMVG